MSAPLDISTRELVVKAHKVIALMLTLRPVESAHLPNFALQVRTFLALLEAGPLVVVVLILRCVSRVWQEGTGTAHTVREIAQGPVRLGILVQHGVSPHGRCGVPQEAGAGPVRPCRSASPANLDVGEVGAAPLKTVKATVKLAITVQAAACRPTAQTMSAAAAICIAHRVLLSHCWCPVVPILSAVLPTLPALDTGAVNGVSTARMV